jgi:hypothetical protein
MLYFPGECASYSLENMAGTNVLKEPAISTLRIKAGYYETLMPMYKTSKCLNPKDHDSNEVCFTTHLRTLSTHLTSSLPYVSVGGRTAYQDSDLLRAGWSGVRIPVGAHTAFSSMGTEVLSRG